MTLEAIREFIAADMKAVDEVFDLTPRGKQVQLVLTHRRIPNRDFMLSVSGGWHTHLDLLVAHLEGRELPKFWRSHTKIEAEYDRRIPASR